VRKNIQTKDPKNRPVAIALKLKTMNGKVYSTGKKLRIRQPRFPKDTPAIDRIIKIVSIFLCFL
jgi:hypothetical protein